MVLLVREFREGSESSSLLLFTQCLPICVFAFTSGESSVLDLLDRDFVNKKSCFENFWILFFNCFGLCAGSDAQCYRLI